MPMLTRNAACAAEKRRCGFVFLSAEIAVELEMVKAG
jgi:hypothetical protein